MAEKLDASLEVGPTIEKCALLDKIRKLSFCASFIVLQRFPWVASKLREVMAPSLVPFCSAFIVDETSFLFMFGYVEPFRSHVLPTDDAPR